MAASLNLGDTATNRMVSALPTTAANPKPHMAVDKTHKRSDDISDLCHAPDYE